MDGLVPVVFVVVVLVVLSGLRLYAGRLDRERIREHVESHGGKVLNIEYVFSPFATGWRGADNARLYDIRYVTHRGRTITATCATNKFSGVWWPREAPPGLHDPGLHDAGDEVQPSPASAGPNPSSADIRESMATPAD